MGSDGELLVESVIIEGGTQTWKRFATLSYINGQKYTIGKIYSSREEQGEFIFLLPEQLAEINRKRDPLCEIICRENQYWITPKGGNKIFINRKIVNSCTKLKFGDYFSFEKKKDGRQTNAVILELVVHFRFEKREFAATTTASLQNGIRANIPPVRPNTDINCTAIQPPLALQNDLILGHILSYLRIPDLRIARLVSNLWSQEGFKLLKKESTMKLPNVFSNKDKYKASGTMRLFRYDHEMKDKFLDNWKVELPSFTSDMVPRNGNPAVKLIDDLNWVFSKKPKITILELDGDVKCQLDYDVRMQILTHLQDTIQDLSFGSPGTWVVSKKRGINYSLPESLNFRQLKKFRLFVNVVDHKNQEQNDFPWFRQLIPVISNVRGVEIQGGCDLALILVNNLNFFSNLVEISILDLNLAGWQLLLQLSPHLKKFSAHILSDSELDQNNAEEYLTAFEQLLQKNKGTLESLCFTILDQGKDLRIRIPSLPHLKELDILCLLDTKELVDIKLVFGGNHGPICYKEHFPVLHSLHVAYFDEGLDIFQKNFESFLLSLFPFDEDEMEICPTLRRLNVSSYPDANLNDLRYNAISREDWAKMFPNVDNSWMKKVRERQEKNLPIILDPTGDTGMNNRMVLRSAFRRSN